MIRTNVADTKIRLSYRQNIHNKREWSIDSFTISIIDGPSRIIHGQRPDSRNVPNWECLVYKNRQDTSNSKFLVSCLILMRILDTFMVEIRGR